MKISEAEHLLSDELDSAEDEPSRGANGDYDTVPSTAAELRSSPSVLPFLSVLLLGRDGAWNENDHERPTPHPSVGYVQKIYAAIALNWVVDLVGLVYLFYTYVAAWHHPVGRIGVPLLIGTALASGFSVFAVSLVQRPLPKPGVRRLTSQQKALFVVVGLVCVTLGLISITYADVGGRAMTLMGRGALVALGLVAATALVAGYGGMDAGYVLVRVVVMVSVGFIVAGPIHEAMFQTEIEQSFYARREKALETDIAELEDGLEKRRNDRTYVSGDGGEMRREMQEAKDCEAKVKLLIQPPDCDEERQESERAELIVSAWELVVSDQRRGTTSSRARQKFKEANQEKLGIDRVQEIMKRPVIKHTKSKTLRKYEDELSSAQDERRDAIARLNDCRDTRNDLEGQRHKQRQTCEQTAATDRSTANTDDTNKVTDRLNDLRRVLSEYKTRARTPGAIERGLELEHLVHEAGGLGGDVERARGVVRRKLLTAWILAMIMPLIIVAMKLTGGRWLEPYVERRWRGY